MGGQHLRDDVADDLRDGRDDRVAQGAQARRAIRAAGDYARRLPRGLLVAWTGGPAAVDGAGSVERGLEARGGGETSVHRAGKPISASTKPGLSTARPLPRAACPPSAASVSEVPAWALLPARLRLPEFFASPAVLVGHSRLSFTWAANDSPWRPASCDGVAMFCLFSFGLARGVAHGFAATPSGIPARVAPAVFAAFIACRANHAPGGSLSFGRVPAGVGHRLESCPRLCPVVVIVL